MASQSDWEEQWQTFLNSGAFKVLALAGLSGNAHSVVLYLLNCFVSGIRDVLTSSSEMSVLLGIGAHDVDQILTDLSEMSIVRIDRNSGDRMVLSLNLNLQTWSNLKLPAHRDSGQRRRIGDAANVRPIRPQERPPSAHLNWSQSEGSGPKNEEGRDSDNGALSGSLEALNFPLRQVRKNPDSEAASAWREGEAALAGADVNVREGAENGGSESQQSPQECVLAAFLAVHPEASSERERVFAEALVATHPVEQITDIIWRFPVELRSLGLLLGAWLHFSQKRDQAERAERPALLDEYRKQAEDADRQLRLASRRMLKLVKAGRIELSSDEEVLLHVLHEHDVPRRQLYWALRKRTRYPALADFFAEVHQLAQAPAGPSV